MKLCVQPICIDQLFKQLASAVMSIQKGMITGN